ncbi:MAG: peptidase M23B [uncultured bacterium]|nr:MAG: peptidase M23B [uncultured bacterium]OGJ47939.1 MAG: hypothetical protein A2344_04130 [Candidatus Peregrinibacteria bacterium RIFOXYB12_FULL_41_12]OGJ48517.1 MAG: hypothetical protein A2244_05850 [Candidatus Peregrinibacteria bacterium RIFOXYA2_FULL_41_18]OGJ52769.1 MAG: hypothetical protein A2448_02655 [Candidatus Peregrinibacteria bacterium RIFOXYC2_FULL_41_22]OGJ52831.1 MAG: hypothetical protein A2336_03200 [Candidatus Peregrinibacteria bacterium RIFOXYB2_FULL_41_88]
MEESLTHVDIPFDPEASPIFIIQGWDGPFSHRIHGKRDLRYSVDFALPLGTPVLSGVSGVVKCVWISGFSYDGVDLVSGLGMTGTFVSIAPDHNSDLRVVYSHLDPNSLCVDRGDHVESGTVLGKTGLSGWVGPIPHLHTHIQRSVCKGPSATIPFSINGIAGSLADAEVVIRTERQFLGFAKIRDQIASRAGIIMASIG